MHLRICLTFTILMLGTSCFAGSSGAPSFEELSWLSGCWKGTGLGGEVEECWMLPADEKLIGVFQLAKDGRVQFSEIVMIAKFEETFGMRVKHFDASFNQWEKDKGTGHTFAYVEMGKNFIQFEQLRYELQDSKLHVTLGMKKGEDTHNVSFVYERVGD